MEIHERHVGRILLLAVSGQATLSAQPERLCQTIQGRLAAGDRLIVLNLADCTKMDSTGLGELVRAQRLVSDADGVLKLARVPAFVRSLLHVTNLTELVELFDTEQAAIHSFGA